jgi:hypothetical protein
LHHLLLLLLEQHLLLLSCWAWLCSLMRWLLPPENPLSWLLLLLLLL